MSVPTAYPLTWPFGWPRTAPGARRQPAFRSVIRSKSPDGTPTKRTDEIRLTDARERLADELEKLRASHVVLSTNVELRADGQPRASGYAPGDPGAAVYFKLRGRDVVLACDRWTTVAGNMAALAAHIDAMRGQDRWGVGSIEQAFAGYVALPSAMTVNDWRAELGNPSTLDQAEAVYRDRMKTAHPDAGGSTARAAALNAAIAAARKATW